MPFVEQNPGYTFYFIAVFRDRRRLLTAMPIPYWLTEDDEDPRSPHRSTARGLIRGVSPLILDSLVRGPRVTIGTDF